MNPIIPLPDATTTFNLIGPWSSAIFSELSPMAWVVIGVSVGCIIVAWIIYIIPNAVSKLTHRD